MSTIIVNCQEFFKTFVRDPNIAVFDIDLKYMHLLHSDFRNVFFRNVNFRECDIDGADFRGATFEDCDFRGIKNFETARFKSIKIRDVRIGGDHAFGVLSRPDAWVEDKTCTFRFPFQLKWNAEKITEEKWERSFKRMLALAREWDLLAMERKNTK